jgi:hypothetical protein
MPPERHTGLLWPLHGTEIPIQPDESFLDHFEFLVEIDMTAGKDDITLVFVSRTQRLEVQLLTLFDGKSTSSRPLSMSTGILTRGM